jgi:hypothetical protein
VPAGGVANRSRAASGISVLALQTRLRGARWTGTGRGRVTPAQTALGLPRRGDDYRSSAPPRPRKHGLELGLWDDESPRSEPRWNADRCAHPAGCAAVPAARHEDHCVCRRSASFIYGVAKWRSGQETAGTTPSFSVGHSSSHSNVASFARLGHARAARATMLIRPRESGGGGPRSCAGEGASDSSLHRRRKNCVESDAPSTTLRVVPPSPLSRGRKNGFR